jgi:hypothetical protein
MIKYWRSIYLPLLFTFSCLAIRGVLAQSKNVATVEVFAYDTRGIKLDHPKITAFRSDDSGDYASHFEKGVAGNIPFGLYRLQAEYPSHYAGLRYVLVYQQKVNVIVGLYPGFELPIVAPSFVGHIMNYQSSKYKWTFAKLIGIYSSESLESLIDNEGRFRFAGTSNESYILLIVSDKGVLAKQLFTLPLPKPQEVEIKISE